MGKKSLHIIASIGLSGLMITALAWNVACKSPASPVSPPKTPTYAYGLYDNFESGSISQTLWINNEPRWVSVKDDATGNKFCELNNTHLYMNDPGSIYPDAFGRLSARLMIPSGSESPKFAPELGYSVRILDRPLYWWAKIGIRPNGAGIFRFFGLWKDLNSGNKWEATLPDVKFDMWYNVEMEMVKVSATELRIIYRVDGKNLGETAPEDGPALLDKAKLGESHRYLDIADEAGNAEKGWFDDVWGMIGHVSADSASSLWEVAPTPLEFLGIPSNSGRPERFYGPIRGKEIPSDSREQKER
jgi:hypothetical protein